MHDLYSLTFKELLEYIKSIGGAIVVWRPVGGIGDAVMILPAITGLRAEWGEDVPIIVICIDYIDPIFRHHPDVDLVIALTADEIGAGKDLTIAIRLRKTGAIVYPLYYPCPAARYEADNLPYIVTSRQEIFATNCDVSPDSRDYNFAATENDMDSISKLPLQERYIVVHLCSHDKWRDYPKILTMGMLAKLARWRKKYDIQIVTIDTNQDFGIQGVYAIRDTHLNSIIAVIQNALMVIGPDSSMVHIGGALGRNVLGLFGPTNPGVRLHYPSVHCLGKFDGCERQYCWYAPCARKYCLSTLPPVRVVGLAKTILKKEGMI